VSSYTYIAGHAKFLAGSIDLDSDDLRVKLVMTNTTADTDTTAEFLDDISTLDEFNGSGYEEGTLTGRSIVDGVLHAAPTSFFHLSAGTRDIAGAVVYKYVTNAADSPVLAWVAFSYSPTGNTISLTWSNGVFNTLFPTTVASGIILPFDGTHAGVPSGWTRATAFDDKYPKSVAGDGGGTGGSNTHTHTSPSHSHSVGAHTHAAGTTNTGAATGDTTVGASVDFARGALSHTHTIPTSGAVSGTPTVQGAGTFDLQSNEPPYYETVFIQSDGTPTALPTGGLAWFNDTTPPNGYSQHSDSVERYLKGAAASGDAGGTGGGSAHSHTGESHTHPDTHQHAGVTSGQPGTTATTSTAISQAITNDFQHTHVITATATSGTSGAGTSGATGSATVEPPYFKLQVVEGTTLVSGLIGLWTSTLATVPSGWLVCNGTLGLTPDLTGKFIKNTAVSSADLGATGGSTTHDHTNPSAHTHSGAPGHTHPATAAQGTGSSEVIAGASLPGVEHAHTVADYASGTYTSGSAVQTVDEATDVEPAYVESLFVRLIQPLTILDPVVVASAPAIFKSGSFTKTIRKKKVG